MNETMRMSPPHAGHWRGNSSPNARVHGTTGVRAAVNDGGFCGMDKSIAAPAADRRGTLGPAEHLGTPEQPSDV